MNTTIHEAITPELLKSWDGVLTPMVPWKYRQESKIVQVLSGFQK